ncbi:MAG: glucarate dehydratase [Planctomycetes bacterium]|nr:glucarate dehydratase [Planctomycetota bacterium]
MQMNRREWLAAAGIGTFSILGWNFSTVRPDQEKAASRKADLVITGLRVTPIALPDPPILAASGCHGPYFLRNVVEIETGDGVAGIGETHGGESVTKALELSRGIVAGQSAFAYQKFGLQVAKLGLGCYAGVELACLDAIGKATGRRLCELLGGPVRDPVEFAAYLFFRYAADHPKLLADPRVADGRGRGEKAFDPWGEIRTPQAMAELAWQFQQRWGFRCFKLKAGVLPPEVELEALRAIKDRLGGQPLLRIDPNERWKVETALRIGGELKKLPLEYYEDPVSGQEAMAEVRKQTGLRMSTNSCVTGFRHIPKAIETRPIDVVLCDHHVWGGIPACQALGKLCESLGWGVSQHSNSHAGITMAAMVHVAAVMPQLTCASDTHYPWLVEGSDLIEGGKLRIVAGRMEVPGAPGLGVHLDRDQLARAHEVYKKCGMRRRDDAHTMRLVEPTWQPALF